MSGQHFITGDDIPSLVPDALECLAHQHPCLVIDKKNKIVISTFEDPNTRVALISGGGAGHEPSHAMYVGPGMLTAAVSGNIFASPGVPQIIKCIQAASGRAGTILIVKNYTGDIFHFSQAAQKLRAERGMRVEVVVVADDVSLERSKVGKVGRRGLAGTVLMHKVLGGMASRGKSIDECLEVSKRVCSGLATIGASLGHVHIPGQPLDYQNHPTRGSIELGMGIHNEPGAKVLAPQPNLDELIDSMLKCLLDTADEERGYVDFNGATDVVLMINNLGALSVLELSAITTKTVNKLGQRGIFPTRTNSNTFMTSLDGPGWSLTLLKADPEIITYLDEPTSALGWPVPFISAAERAHVSRGLVEDESIKHELTVEGVKTDPLILRSAILGACESGVDTVPSITHYDTIVGDGDCGITLERGCQAVLKLLNDPSLVWDDALVSLLRVAEVLEDSMDGTSGAIYSLFFNGLASSLRECDPKSTMNPSNWAKAAAAGLHAVQSVTPARTGDRTLMDALEPFVESLQHGLQTAVGAAIQGADLTKGMKPAFGRAVYVNEEG